MITRVLTTPRFLQYRDRDTLFATFPARKEFFPFKLQASLSRTSVYIKLQRKGNLKPCKRLQQHLVSVIVKTLRCLVFSQTLGYYFVCQTQDAEASCGQSSGFPKESMYHHATVNIAFEKTQLRAFVCSRIDHRTKRDTCIPSCTSCKTNETFGGKRQ